MDFRRSKSLSEVHFLGDAEVSCHELSKRLQLRDPRIKVHNWMTSGWKRRAALVALTFMFAGAMYGQTSSAERDALRQGFAQPPGAAKLRCYWWWLNGNTTEATITRDLTEMSRKGFGGVLLVDANGSNQEGNDNAPPGPKFGSPDWVRLYVFALKTAATLHIEVTLNILSGWNLGGPDVTPADASKLLTWSRTEVGEKGFEGVLAMPTVMNGYYHQIAVLAYPLAHGAALPGEAGNERDSIDLLSYKTASKETGISMEPSEPLLEDRPSKQGEEDATLQDVVDLSALTDAAGHINWRPPSKGAWEILRIGYTNSDARVSTSSDTWQGLAIDHLDRGAFDTYWTHTVVPLLNVSRPYLGSTLLYLATDSWELNGINWTGRFADEFRKRRGYDPVRYLPIVAGRIIQDRATSNRFLNDLRRTVGDLVTDHYDHFAERAKEFGLGTQCESGGPHGEPLDALETFRSSAMPQTEFWALSKKHRISDEERVFTKEAASAANIYGKKIAANEGMTSIGPEWSESLATDLKPTFDQALTEGMNRLVWHEFTSIPESAGLPGNEYFAGTHLNPNITWWNQSDAFFLYLNRSQYMLQQGHAVDDVLYFYGDQVPNFVRLKLDDPARVLPGYDYDVTSEDALLHSLSVHSGGITTPAGNEYKILVLPKSHRLSLAAMERIASYVKQGGRIVGQPPIGPTGIVDEDTSRRYETLKHDLWGGCSQTPHLYGAGRVFCDTDARAALRQMKIQQDFVDTSGSLDYVHRSDGLADIYFVRNGSAHAVDTKAGFRVAGRQPELWNALDGSIEPLNDFQIDNDITQIPLHLAPFGSIFVVFSQPIDSPEIPFKARTPQVTSVELPANQWTISFQENRGAPSGAQKLQGFTSWTESRDAGVRYFSGTATYRTEFDAKLVASDRMILTLNDLREICTVRVNGQPAGTIWALPYRLDLTGNLKNGKNALELEVANLWPNRIIGDAQPSNLHSYTKTNIRTYTSDSPLFLSGLIGPVSIETIHAGTAQPQGESAMKP